MSERLRIVGSFTDEETCVRGIVAVREAGLGSPRVFSPFVSEPILEALQTAESPVRRWVLLGGITGCASGFALTIGLSAEYPHVTASMPIVSIPPFVIIAFELTILFGALSGLIGFLVHGGFSRFDSVPAHGTRFSDDLFGVLVECAGDDRLRAVDLLRAAGAIEVSDEPA